MQAIANNHGESYNFDEEQKEGKIFKILFSKIIDKT